MKKSLRAVLLVLVTGISLGAYFPRQVLTPAGSALEKWADSSFPIVWRLNPGTGPNLTGDRDFAEVLRQSFLAWDAVPTAQISFVEGPPTTIANAAYDGVNLISANPSQYTSDAIALTLVYSFAGPGVDPLGRIVQFPGQILEADILFNPNVSLSTNLTTPNSRTDLQSLAMHHIGHVLGLDHSGLPSAVMFPTVDAGTSHLRALSGDDRLGISLFYPGNTFMSGTGSARGVVRTLTGLPVNGAHVVLVDSTGRAAASVISGPDGVYQVDGLEPGSYFAFAGPQDYPFASDVVWTFRTAGSGIASPTDYTTRFAVTGSPAQGFVVSPVAGNNQQGLSGEPLSAPVEVQVKDANGNPVTGVAVTFAATGGGGTVAPVMSTTDAQGKARTTVYLGMGPQQTFTASAGAAKAGFAASVRDSVRFAVIGDYGFDTNSSESDVANLIKSWNPDFVITTGDNNYFVGAASTIDQNIGQFYHQFISPYLGIYGAGATHNRFFPSLGNHDWGTSGAQPYLDYFTLPGNERYYDFTKGPVHFFSIDSDTHEPDGTVSTSVQGQWLQSRLQSSNSCWKLVYMHHPPYSSGPHGSTARMQWPYRIWGADAALAGHDHTYERIIADNFLYIVDGLGGNDIYSFGNPVAGSQVRYNADWGALLVTATRGSITFQFVTRSGSVIDTHTMTKSCP